MEPESQQTPRTPTTSRFLSTARWIWRRVENVVFGFVVVLITLYFILQLPPVQNWLIGRITGYLSSELNTTVRIRHVDIEFFDAVLLEDFYVADQQGDTLLYAQRLSAGLTSNFFAFLGRKLEFDEIALSRARFNLLRREGQADNNLQFIIDYFSRPRKGPRPPSEPFILRVQNLRLNDVEFAQRDAVSGRHIFGRVGQGAVRINHLDFISKTADVRSAAFDGLVFELRQYEGKPLTAVGEKPSLAPPPSDSLRASATPRRPFVFTIGEFSLQNSRFALDKFTSSPGVSTPDGVMDYNHLDVRDIAIKASDIFGNEDLIFGGRLQHLGARERSGFVLTHGEATTVVVSDTLTALYGLKLQTPGTYLTDTVTFQYETYRDFRRFNDRVRMDIRLAPGSYVQLGDLQHFAPALMRNSFFVTNREQVANLSGQVQGRVNALRGRGLDVRIGNNAYARFDFRGDDLAEGSDRLILDFKFADLQTDFATVRRIIPGLTVPPAFDRLGNIGFAGAYQIIYGYNHVLTGGVRTSIGTGSLDMELDLTKGRERATYSGKLGMQNFDLGAWTGNRSLGKATFNVDIAEGSTGLTPRTLNASGSAQIVSLDFRGYTYRNVAFKGDFKDLIFNGEATADDPNLALDFKGNINFSDTVPMFAFSATVARLDLGALHFTQEDLRLSGTVDYLFARGKSWLDFTGSASVSDLQIVQDKEIVHRIGLLAFQSGLYEDGRRYLTIESDLVDASLEGRYDLRTVPRNLTRLFARYFPEFGGRLGLNTADTTAVRDVYNLNFTVHNSRALTQLFLPELDTLRNITGTARVDGPRGFTELLVDVPYLHYNNIVVYNVGFYWRSTEEHGQYQFTLPNSRVGRQRLAPIQLQGDIFGDILSFNLRARDSAYFVSSVNLAGELSVSPDSIWQLHFNPSEIALLNQQWYMEGDNYLRFGRNFFDAQNFYLSSGDQRIFIESFNDNRGLFLSLTNLDLALIDNFLPGKNLRVRGKVFDFEVKVADLYRLNGIHGAINTDTIFVNQRPYGVLFGSIDLENPRAAVSGDFHMLDFSNRQLLRVAGAWAPKSIEGPRTFDGVGTVRPGEMQVEVTADDFPLFVLETFVPGISRTAGRFDADVRLSGPLSRFNTDGRVLIEEGQFQIDYLKTLYYLRRQPVRLTNYQIWADGDTIWDASGVGTGNFALVQGGLRHNHFKDWQIACSVVSHSDEFMVLNTTREENALYYGQALGSFTARFSGTFARPDIRIDAVTGPQTRLYIPLSTASDAGEVSFINFSKKSTDTLSIENQQNARTAEEIKGLNFEMNLTVTEVAEVQLIFDEAAGDIIRGRGAGDIKLLINRDGDFRMYGNYVIQRGEYLFTLLNFVNKPFTVLQGGTINWNGDPYAAQIRLDATYEELSPLYNFLRDEVEVLRTVQQDLFAEAQKPTRAVVTMHLQGELLKPNITFDLEFPQVATNLRSLAENRLRILSQDQNELNRQVFGLIVVGTFLPSNTTFIGNSDVTTAGVNTVTQMLSRQFSNYITQLASSWFGGTISSLEIDIAYNEYRNNLQDISQQPGLNRDLQLRLTTGLLNDRITVQTGVQFGLGNRPGTSTQPGQNGLVGGDLTLEIQLTKDRRWRLRTYDRLEPDIAGAGQRNRFGLGLSYRQEYESLHELLSDLGSLFRDPK